MDKSIVGILPQDEIRKRLLEIATGKLRHKPHEPKVWSAATGRWPGGVGNGL